MTGLYVPTKCKKEVRSRHQGMPDQMRDSRIAAFPSRSPLSLGLRALLASGAPESRKDQYGRESFSEAVKR
jgi:hypothetical protein